MKKSYAIVAQRDNVISNPEGREMKLTEHYARRYKRRIMFLEQRIREYYMANYSAKRSIGIDPGVCGVASLTGNEESLVLSDAESMRKVIDGLPLMDCGV